MYTLDGMVSLGKASAQVFTTTNLYLSADRRIYKTIQIAEKIVLSFELVLFFLLVFLKFSRSNTLFYSANRLQGT